MLRDSVVVVRTRPRAIPLAMITMRKSTHGFRTLSYTCLSMGLRLAAFRAVGASIQINVENCTIRRAKVFVILYANCSTNSYFYFNPCGIFEIMTSFSPILNQGLELEKINDDRKFFEIKVQNREL